MGATTVQGPGSQAPWLPVYASVAAVAVVVADHYRIVAPPRSWQMPAAALVAALIGAAVAVVVTLGQEGWRGGQGWWRPLLHRVTVFLTIGGWLTWTLLAGWGTWTLLALSIITVSLSAVGLVAQTPAAVQHTGNPAEADGRGPRTPDGRYWQIIIRRVTKLPITVVRWEPWTNPLDGLRLFVELPTDGSTVNELADKARNLAYAARLKAGCSIRVSDSDTQGAAVVDIMLRNTMTDQPALHIEPTTPASINDSFPILRTPAGELLSVCLRIFSMVIGGTIGSGKTTLLHRIIMFLARCTDTLIWVIDLNGGRLAQPWIRPYLEGRAAKPVVDWVATDEAEAATMVAVARAVATDRATDPECIRRKDEANSTVLPVDRDKPAVLLLTDEGGEVRQATQLLGQLAGMGVTRIAQIGRGEGFRAILSVLRGTSDLTDKAFRVVAALRMCLRMDEHEEYGHVLTSNPAKGGVDLGDAEGAGFLETPKHRRAVLGRTPNVDLRGIGEHAVATAALRPDLDDRGRRAAARVRMVDVLEGKEVWQELTDAYPHVIADVQAGRAYEGRWDRYRAALAVAMGGGQPSAGVPAAANPNPASGTAAGQPPSPLDEWVARVKGNTATVPQPSQPAAEPAPEGARIIQLFPNGAGRSAAAAGTVRDQILELLRQGPKAASDLERETHGARSRVYTVLGNLRREEIVGQDGQGRYELRQQSR